MYDQYYGFAKKPFSISPDPEFLFFNPAYREAYAMLRYGIEERRGIICLIGEVGTGKTMLLNKLLQSLDKEVRIPTVSFPITAFRVLVTDLVRELRVPAGGASFSEQLAGLRRHLLKETRKDHIVAVLIDEAQTLSVEALESLRLLSNIETPKEKLIQIVLSGQPELKSKLHLTELRQFKQRVATSFQLRPLNASEVPLYIAHRMNVAGNTRGLGLFTEEALSLVVRYSEGIPRLINALCENSLLIGYALGKPRIDGGIVRESARDLMVLKDEEASDKGPPVPAEQAPEEEAPPRRRQGSASRFKWAACIAFAAVLLGFGASRTLLQDWAVTERTERALRLGLSKMTAGLGTAARDGRTDESTEGHVSVPGISIETEIPSETEEPPARGLSVPPAAADAPAEALVSAPPGYEPMETASLPAPAPAAAPEAVAATAGGWFSPDEPRDPGGSRPWLTATDPALPVEGLKQAPPAAGSPEPPLAPLSSARAVQAGQTISSMTLEMYGFLNSYVYALVHFGNPGIPDLDVVRRGQIVSFPPLRPESHVFRNPGGGYFLLIGACQEMSRARRWKAWLAGDGEATAEIRTTPITSREHILCLLMDGFSTREEALARLAQLRQLPSSARIMEENREQNT